MRIEIKNINELIAFIENAPKLSDNDVIKLISKTMLLYIPFNQTKEQTIKQLKEHYKMFGHLPIEDRPLFLCSKQKDFSIKDIFNC